MRKINQRSEAVALALCLALVSCATAQDKTKPAEGVQISQLADRFRVEINGKLFTEYHFKDVQKPYCYPVLGPSEVAMTRKWPQENVPGEEHDHPHHTGLWFGHQNVNADNFWTVTPDSGKEVQEEIVNMKSGKDIGSFTTRNKWVGKSGAVVLTDERTLRFYNRPGERVMDFEITIKASEGDVTFGDEKDGLMAIRVPESVRALQPKGKAGDGHIVMSNGTSDDGESTAAAKAAKKEAQTWGKHAEWVDYYGPVEGKTVGVAIFDHPGNPRHPTSWHVRDYGLFAANPFGKSYFENLPDKHAGDLKIAKGESLTFRYRFYFHDGDTKQAKVAEHY